MAIFNSYVSLSLLEGTFYTDLRSVGSNLRQWLQKIGALLGPSQSK